MTELYIPLLADFSREDKAAKGLRSLREPRRVPERPVYYSAREVVDFGGAILLLGARGGGKTEFAKRLGSEPGFYYVAVMPQTDFAALPRDLTLVLDDIDRLGAKGALALAEALKYSASGNIVALADAEVAAYWPIPEAYQIHKLLPLLRDQREQALTSHSVHSPAALSLPAATPALFQLALSLQQKVETAEELIDFWLARKDAETLVKDALRAVASGTSRNRALDDLLAARAMQGFDVARIAADFGADPHRWRQAVAHLLARLDGPGSLVAALIALKGDAGALAALLVSPFVTPASPDFAAVRAALLEIVEAGLLSFAERDRAARVLARDGDPRDLSALASVPGGPFTLGSNTHPNSAPAHVVDVKPFRIGLYPVTNCQYADFVTATGRDWQSPERDIPDRRNAPATWLSWRDARACCDWLTARWRREGRIGADEIVRLPNEVEWERAARGDQPDRGDSIVYPWDGAWDRFACNSEQSGFNEPCAVGLYPTGRSPYGCFDMAGQVWEWTTTLWGEYMTSPSFSYPYADDGREDPDAGSAVRRVLRGGCFSSGSAKACATYKGSLEPDGTWRGNGFRIVLAAIA